MNGGFKFSSSILLEEFDSDVLIFDESEQKLFTVDSPAGMVIKGLRRGVTPTEIARQLSATLSMSRHEARAYLVRCILEWRHMGFFRRETWRSPAPDARRPRQEAGFAGGPAAAWQVIDVAGTRVRLLYRTDCVARLVAPVFSHLETDGDPGAYLIQVSQSGAWFSVSVNGLTCGEYVEPQNLVPFLKACLSEIVMLGGAYSLALHAASVERDGRAIVLSGPSGSGKTTLALAMVRRGCALMGDDTLFYDAESRRGRGVPFRAGIKDVVPGTLETAVGDVERLHVRDDGVELRYVDPRRWCLGWRPLGMMAFPRFERGARTRVRRLDGVEALTRLLSQAHAPERHLRGETFRSMAREVRSLPCVELVYASLDEACDALEQWRR